MKWVLLLIVAAIGYMVATGNMGGAKEATGNFVDVRKNQTPPEGYEVKPSPLSQMIEYNKENNN
ncbi:MAG: hypothetical protein U9Q30_07655 [Campylobacterota bacterium]|nr:hypothetical protein [Campylobacterota bacterium]